MAQDIFKSRQRDVQLVFAVVAGSLIFRAAQLQVFSPTYSKRADATTIDKFTSYPSRGQIFDRNGHLLVNNEATYDLMVTYSLIDQQMDTAKFCKFLGIQRAEFTANLAKDWKSGRFSKAVPFVFLKKISTQTYARFQENLHEFSGFFAQLRVIRGYPYRAGAHVLGYINEVNDRDIDREPTAYVPGDYIGSAGLEQAYEKELRGKKGTKYLLRDNLGRIVGPYKNGSYDTTATSGADLIASIDAELQAYGEKLMSGKTGSIVAIEPKTGEILTMVSAPTYDPNLLTLTADRGPIFFKLLNHPLKPFFDRTVMAKYPPGSIFKTIVELVGLQKGVLSPHRGWSCGGGYFYAGRLYKCHNHAGVSNAVDAIANSCNAYYFSGVREIIDMYGFSNPQQGLDTLNQYVRTFGVGVQTGIDYPNESAGNIPTSTYYDKIYPKKLGGWRSPTVMSIGIGQGEIQMTALQQCNIACAIANRGYWYPPHLAKEFRDHAAILPKKYFARNRIPIDRQHFDLVVEGMAECINRGTARVAQIPGIQVCGKTGTSQNPHGEDHSVFVAFAPKDNPKIAIAVFVENGGWGATYAAPIASLMIEKYLTGSIAEARLPLEKKMVEANLVARLEAVYAGKARPDEEQPVIPAVPKGDSLPSPAIVPKEQGTGGN